LFDDGCKYIGIDERWHITPPCIGNSLDSLLIPVNYGPPPPVCSVAIHHSLSIPHIYNVIRSKRSSLVSTPSRALSASDMLNSSPTRMNLTLTKGRLKGAQTGHSLLAKKRDALMTRFRSILKKVDEVSCLIRSI